MTATGKLIAGTVILAASVMTAKYLHQPALETKPAPATKSAAPRLTWQIRESATHTDTALQPVAMTESLDSTQFARLASAQDIAAQSPIGTVTAPEYQSAPSALPDGQFQRQSLPFAVSAAPASQLMLVDDEELDPASLVKDYVEHTVQFGETLPDIALKYLGRREAYMAVYQANLDVLTNPAEVSPGIVLKIPVR